jgi:hypothetical protein
VPHRPRVAQPRGVDFHAATATLRRSLWHDTDSGADLDHPAHGVEARHACPDVQGRTQPSGVSDDVPLKGAFARQSNEWAVDGVGQAQLSPAG